MSRIRRRVLIVVAFFGLWPAAAWAQQTSGIAGVVRDTSGGVLPFTGNATWLFLLGVAFLGAGTLLLSLTRRSALRAEL